LPIFLFFPGGEVNSIRVGFRGENCMWLIVSFHVELVRATEWKTVVYLAYTRLRVINNADYWKHLHVPGSSYLYSGAALPASQQTMCSNLRVL